MKTALAPALTAVNPDDRQGDIEQGDLLSVDEAARFLHVPPSWVYEHARRGVGDRLPVVKIGKYLRFDRRDLRAYVDAKRATAQRQPERR